MDVSQTASRSHRASCTSSQYSAHVVGLDRTRDSLNGGCRGASKTTTVRKDCGGPATSPTTKSAPPKIGTPLCSAPLSIVFGIGCVAIAIFFATITVVSSVTFNSQVESSVKESLGTAMQGAMKYITDPLVQSQRYAHQLKDMIEADPTRYACDDSVITYPGNTSNQNFYFEAGMYALQHPNIQLIYQSRLSKRYLRLDGLGPAGICCLIGPAQKTVGYMFNNSQYSAPFANSTYFASLASAVPMTFRVADITSLALIRGPATTPTSRWISDSINIAAAGLTEPTNKYSYILHVNDPSNSSNVWAIGIDHTTATLKSTLLQATPPITVALPNVAPSQTAGAHTTLYDLNENLIMASTHPQVPIAREYGVLFQSGQSPAAEVNAAYADAVSRCEATGCANAVVTVGKSDVQTVYKINIPESKLHLLMVSSVPRAFFFASADRTFATTLGLSIGCCILVIGGCVALLVMIRRPLSKLKDNMLLAAQLHNDRVEHTSTHLAEIGALSAVFDQMNQQLLIARSFVPEAVLLGQTEDSHNVDDEGSVTDVTDEKSTSWKRQQPSSQGMGRGDGLGASDSIDVTNASKTSSTGMTKLFTVTEKRVGVLSLNLVGFHALCAPERTITRAHKVNVISTSLLTAAVACSHAERGVMDSFHGDHFTITFNASRVVAGPLAAAVRAANSFIFNVNENPSLGGPVKGVAAGAAAGKAHVGSLGIDGHRRMSVVGEVYRTATALQQASLQFLRMSGHLGLREGCMVEESAERELGSCGIHLQAVGCIVGSDQRARATTKVPLVYFALDADVRRESAAAMQADGEWLYELDALESSDPFREPNRAIEALVRGDSDQCGLILKSHKADFVAGEAPRHASTRKVMLSVFGDSTSSAGTTVCGPAHHAWVLVEYYFSALLSHNPPGANVPPIAHHGNTPFVFFQH